jgi:hypothetical protein
LYFINKNIFTNHKTFSSAERIYSFTIKRQGYISSSQKMKLNQLIVNIGYFPHDKFLSKRIGWDINMTEFLLKRLRYRNKMQSPS